MFKMIKKAYEHYPRLGSNTRLIIRIIVISVFMLSVASYYCENAVNSPYYYYLISISEDLITAARSIASIGFLGIMITGSCEKNTTEQQE